MSTTTEESNKALVLEAFDTLFNKRDYEAAARFWSPSYIQHSAHIEPGREGLFNLVRALPPTLKYQPGVIAASGDYVIVHGRFSGNAGPRLDRRGVCRPGAREHWEIKEARAASGADVRNLTNWQLDDGVQPRSTLSGRTRPTKDRVAATLMVSRASGFHRPVRGASSAHASSAPPADPCEPRVGDGDGHRPRGAPPGPPPSQHPGDDCARGPRPGERLRQLLRTYTAHFTRAASPACAHGTDLPKPSRVARACDSRPSQRDRELPEAAREAGPVRLHQHMEMIGLYGELKNTVPLCDAGREASNQV
jgi:predicted SnoaL-like aldol condensation-catalyzing enzyme